MKAPAIGLGSGWRSGESHRLLPMWPGYDSRTRDRFSKAPETFRARKAFSINLHLKTERTMRMKLPAWKDLLFILIICQYINQLCNNKAGDSALAFRVRKLFGTFEKRTLASYVGSVCCWCLSFSEGFCGFLPSENKNNISKFQFNLERGPAWKPALPDGLPL